MNTTIQNGKKFRLSLSASILLGLILGILCGLFFGEYCRGLAIIGHAFIKLLQMSILPYIIVSLIVGIGSLSFKESKLFALKGGLWILVFWAIGLAIILTLPLTFPAIKSASFFSQSLVQTQEKIDYLNLFIPSNPIRSMADNIIPAVVVFSIAVGVALIGLKDKQSLIQPLSILSKALTNIARFMVKLAPIGVFAISASFAGTMTLEELGRLHTYFITYFAAALFLTFWVLPMFVATLTPFKYKDILGMAKDALITGFTTDNLFIILPILIQNCKDLFQKYKSEQKKSSSFIDIIIPVSFNFPHIGKLLALLFILFAAWFYGNPLPLTK
ncbi:cation:dicarboxylase symporter family transporter, partial [bacterium]|nr:cation:dicarboxylase symporter family transporter [bacterium]